MRVHKEVPISEITLRKFEKPYGDIDTCLRKLLMSVGLLQVGESRDDIVKIFKTLLLSKGKILKIGDIIKKTGASPSNARRHLRRLRGLGFVESIGGGYRISEGKSLVELVSGIVPEIKSTVERIREYAIYMESLMPSQKDS